MSNGYNTSAAQRLIASFAQKEEEARAANIKRQEAITAIFDEIIARYGPGGAYGAAALEKLRKTKVADVSAAS